MSDYDDDEPGEVRKWTTVHSRYHVSGWIGDGAELIEAVQTRAEAFKLARANIGPRDYERTEVYDSMARRGAPDTWDADGKVLATRPSVPDARAAG